MRNDLGYEMHVTRGWLVSRNLELIPRRAAADRSPRARLLRWLGPPAALARHGSVARNESKIGR